MYVLSSLTKKYYNEIAEVQKTTTESLLIEHKCYYYTYYYYIDYSEVVNVSETPSFCESILLY